MLKIDLKLMKYYKNPEHGPEIIMLSLYMKEIYSLRNKGDRRVERNWHWPYYFAKMDSKVYDNTKKKI